MVVLVSRLFQLKTQNYIKYSSKEWRAAKYKQLRCWWWSWWAGCSIQRPKTTLSTRQKSEGALNTNNIVGDGVVVVVMLVGRNQAIQAKDPKTTGRSKERRSSTEMQTTLLLLLVTVVGRNNVIPAPKPQNKQTKNSR